VLNKLSKVISRDFKLKLYRKTVHKDSDLEPGISDSHTFSEKEKEVLSTLCFHFMDPESWLGISDSHAFSEKEKEVLCLHVSSILSSYFEQRICNLP